MLAKRRQQKILTMLESLGEVKIQELATRFGVSAMTIRRDLEGLETQGMVQRTHGGALMPAGSWIETPLANKQEAHREEKNKIADAALEWVSPGMSIILDAGSTTSALVQRLAEKSPLRVVTTDMDIARELSDYEDIEVYITGGKIKLGVYSLQGEYALNTLAAIMTDVAFIGCDGFTADYALSHTVGKTAVKQAMMSAALHKVLLADSSKFNHVAFSKFSPLQQFDAVITDPGLPTTDQKSFLQQGIHLRIATASSLDISPPRPSHS